MLVCKYCHSKNRELWCLWMLLQYHESINNNTISFQGSQMRLLITVHITLAIWLRLIIFYEPICSPHNWKLNCKIIYAVRDSRLMTQFIEQKKSCSYFRFTFREKLFNFHNERESSYKAWKIRTLPSTRLNLLIPVTQLKRGCIDKAVTSGQ